MKHMMVDIETLATDVDAAILSIGACMFDIGNGNIGDKFYINIDLSNSMSRGFNVDPNTIYWWMGQSEGAGEVLSTETVDVRAALSQFDYFCRSNNTKYMWANAPQFDLCILRSAYRRLGIDKFPVHYRGERDMRTIVDLYSGPIMDYEFEGEKHNALDDAINQAKIVSIAWQWIRGGRND